MTSRQYRGDLIISLAKKGKMLTKTVSAKAALKSIVDKYGDINERAEYYHRAKNVWSIHDVTADARTRAEHTGKQYTMSNSHMGDVSRKKTKAGYL